MKIQILGSGCSRCESLAEATEKAARELDIDFELEKISDINQIIEFGVMMTPALVVDGDVKSVGKVLSIDELKVLLKGECS